MKRAVLALLLITPGALLAQQSAPGDPSPDGTVATSVSIPTERVQTPTAADLYCAGFVGKPVEHKDDFVAGGVESPFTTRFGVGDVVFLNGKGYELGKEYTVIRELRDPNRYELFAGQFAAIKAAGQPYEELARVKVVDTRSKMAVARVEYGCDPVVPGDYLVPFTEKPAAAFHKPMSFDRFAPANGQASGRIVMAKDFDSELGTGGKVYLNIGSNQGLKLGDFLKVVRSYSATANDPVESISFKSQSMEPTQTQPAMVDPSSLEKTKGPIVHTSDMPRRAVGEIEIVGTTATTATGMIVFAQEPVHVGDRVEVDQQ